MENSITFQGQSRSSNSYGENYLSEFRRVLLEYGRAETGSFLEWGAGHTTLAIAELRKKLQVESLDTVDHNGAYLAEIAKQIRPWPGFRAHVADLMGPKLSDRDQQPNYGTLPLTWGRRFDYVYIDGRRRLECALVARMVSVPSTVIILHDYRRLRYQPVKTILDVIEDGPQFRVMRPSPTQHQGRLLERV